MDLPTQVTIAILTTRSWEPRRRRPIRTAFASCQKWSKNLVQLARRLVNREPGLATEPASQASATQGRAQA